MLVSGLPPRELAFTYPPHLALVNDGYAMGWRWLAADPALALRRGIVRLARFWAGAATGLTGYGLPGGLSGTRYAVDLTVADGLVARAWAIVVLVACAAGLIAARHRVALLPWLFLLITKAAAAVLFFGYARLGATAIPVVALLMALALERWWPANARWGKERGLRVALLLAVAFEGARWLHQPGLAIDGDPAGPRDPVASSGCPQLNAVPPSRTSESRHPSVTASRSASVVATQKVRLSTSASFRRARASPNSRPRHGPPRTRRAPNSAHPRT
jgi:hypothetical protein